MTEQISKLFAEAYYSDLHLYVITKGNGFEVAHFEDIYVILALIYPGTLPCKSVSLRHLLGVAMDDATKADGIAFGVREDDDCSFFVSREKLAREVRAYSKQKTFRLPDLLYNGSIEALTAIRGAL